MKKYSVLLFRKLTASCMFLIITAISFGQDSVTATTSSTTNTTIWYMRPWAWVLGAVVIITIIFLATGGGKNKKHRTASGKTEEDFAILPDRDTI